MPALSPVPVIRRIAGVVLLPVRVLAFVLFLAVRAVIRALYSPARAVALAGAPVFVGSWRFMKEPVQAGALCCFLFAGGIMAMWGATAYGLHGETRPSPVELATFAARHNEVFLWTGIASFGLHALAIPVVLAIFLTHSDVQRPALWAFTIFFSFALVLWAFFGALSVPIGSSAGPQYGAAMARAGLSPEQRTLWMQRCEVTEENARATGKSLADLAATCERAGDIPLLLLANDAGEPLTVEQRYHLQDAWASAQDVWVVRQVSDTLYFGGIGVYVFALYFFCAFALSSSIIRSFEILVAAASMVAYALGFFAFKYDWADRAIIAGIAGQSVLFVLLGADLWPEKGRFRFGMAQQDERPVRLLMRSTPVADRDIRWTYRLKDGWYRNRQITNTYSRLGEQLRAVIHRNRSPKASYNATWFDFGAWASKSVGEWIWRADLSAAQDAQIEVEFDDFYHYAGGKKILSTGLAEGNLLVFGHTAQVCLRFIEAFGSTVPPADRRKAFETALAAMPRDVDRGYPPSNVVDALVPAFEAYASAAEAIDEDARAAYVLLGNLLLVRYEQEQLQAIIEGSVGNSFRLGFVFLYPASLLRVLVWLVAIPLLGARGAWRQVRKPKPDSCNFGQTAKHWEEWVLETGARLQYGVVHLVFKDWMESLSASRIHLRIGTSTDAEEIVVGRALPYPGSGRNDVSLAGVNELEQLWLELVGVPDEDEDEPDPNPRVENYGNLDERLRFIAVLFRRWQRAAVTREACFSLAERRRDRLVEVASIDGPFDDGLPAWKPATRAWR